MRDKEPKPARLGDSLDGAILAGGKSSRMGRDKASLVIDGRTVLSRVADAMSPHVTRLRIIGELRQAQPQRQSTLERQPDLRPGLGPLSGIHAALRTAIRSRVLVVACDLPFVTRRCLEALSELAAATNAEAIVPRVDGRLIPVCAIYDRRCLPVLEHSLDEGSLSARAFLSSLDVTFLEGPSLDEADPDRRSFFNLNTPADLEEAKRISSD